MRRRGTPVLLLLALLVAGCVSFGAPPPAEAPAAAGAPAPEPEAPAFAPPEAAPAPRLAASMRFSEVWLRPVQDQSAQLDAPGATRVRWFVGIEGVHPEVRFIAGRPYVTAQAGKTADHPASTGLIDPGRAAAVRLVEQGRHLFAVPGHPEATFALTVVSDAPAEESVTAFLAEDGAGSLRVLPERLAVRPGTRVVFVSQVAAPAEVARTAFQPWVGTGGRALNLTPVDEGMYTLFAEVADEAGAQGEARGRFLVDFDRPATRREVGPVDGSFTTGPLAAGTPPAEEREAFEAEYPIRVLRIAANASSPLPGGAAVRVQLARGDEVLADMVTGETDAVTLFDLPAGGYVLRVAHEAGHAVSYEATLRLTYALPVPPALRDG